MAGGTSIYEACVHGIPMLIISIASNQVLHAQAWHQLWLLSYLGSISQLPPNTLLTSFFNICSNQMLRCNMSISSIKAVSGNGARTVASIINSSSLS